MKIHKKELLEAALHYAKQGWSVLPLHTPQNGKCSCGKADCKNIGKHPRYDKDLLPNGVHSASTDAVLIRKWWEKWPDANVGIQTGSKSNLFVLDIDAKNSGLNSFKDLKQEINIPSTLKVNSGGGGFHLYFEHPGGKTKSSTGIKQGIDVRADDAYVVAPPSLHVSGQQYRWEVR